MACTGSDAAGVRELARVLLAAVVMSRSWIGANSAISSTMLAG
jgi:hypothetical protein